MFRIGEKVKFLNEKGGGKVVSIIDKKMVKIETDDGFEMPVLVKDLIKDFRSELTEGYIETTQSVIASNQIIEETKEEIRFAPLNPWGTIKEENGIYLAYEPHDQQWLLTGEIDFMIINNTGFEILYNLLLTQDSKLQGIDYGSVPAKSSLIIETINRDELENWCSGYVQIMFHPDESNRVYLPVHRLIDIKPSRFFKEGSYQENTLLQGKALLVSVAPTSTLMTATGSETEQKHGSVVHESKADIKKEKALIDKYRTAMFEAVVDLHIGELVDNISGLSSHDIFNLQMDTFRKTLESAIRNDYNKVTYIHGVGNGVLKNAIVKDLENYESTDNRLASISKFGVGAIDVLIKNKE